MITSTECTKHTAAGVRFASDDYYRLEGKGLCHSVAFPSGPIGSIVFSSDYKTVRSGHRAVESAIVDDDNTQTLLNIARNPRFSNVNIHYA